MHYEPIRNAEKFKVPGGWKVGGDRTTWKAVIVRPDENYTIPAEPTNIPQLVWLTAAVHGKRTLQTAAHTFESTIKMAEFWNRQLELHGMGLGRF